MHVLVLLATTLEKIHSSSRHWSKIDANIVYNDKHVCLVKQDVNHNISQQQELEPNH